MNDSTALQALQVDRSIEVVMLDNMKFMPDTLQVNEGETIRFVVRNKGKITHEMVLGSPSDIAAHAKEMQEMAATGHPLHQHNYATRAPGAIAVTVPAGESRDWIVKFGEATELEIACLVAGHYEAGMKGQLKVVNPEAAKQTKTGSAQSQAPSQAATSAPSGHDHSAHKH